MKTKSKSTVYRYSSLKHFSWDSKKDISLEEKYVQSTILEWYDAKFQKKKKNLDIMD